MSRVTDYALLIGHVWRCNECREGLLTDPEHFWIGYKLNEQQREAIRSLSDNSFQTTARLTEAAGLTQKELEEGIDHPWARLRHLGVIKYDQRARE